MTSDDEYDKVKILKFSGKDKEWREWSGKFLAQAMMKGYRLVLLGQYGKDAAGTAITVPKHDEELDETKDEDKVKIKLRNQNN